LRSFIDIGEKLGAIPVDVVATLASVEQSRGREDLYRAQAPQVLERLAARTRFDSITASSAIEDIVLDDERALQVIRGTAPGPYSDRSEEEFAGYRDAVDYLVDKEPEPLSVPLLLHLHRTLMRHTDDPLAGKLKVNDNFIGKKNPDGSRSVIFETVLAGTTTERALAELTARYEEALADARIPKLLLIAALVLDLLAIHPFEEGNGRVARLTTTQELLRHGYEVARYVSLEQRIFDSKNSYYLALRQSQSQWHEGAHDVLPWIRYLLRIIEDAYADFEQLVAAGTKLNGGTKRDQARNYVLDQAPRRFRFAQIVDALPDISQATIRAALDDLRDEGRLTATRGRNAMWERVP
jgi:Fic family protein